MDLTENSFSKAGWRWTRQGFKRKPRAPLRKKVSRVTPATKPKRTIAAKAPQIAKEQGRADSAPTPAPTATKAAPRQMRKAWAGKYDDLTKPTKGSRYEPFPPHRR
jgi:hypothetical protein